MVLFQTGLVVVTLLHVWFYLTPLSSCWCPCDDMRVIVLLRCSKAHKRDSWSPGLLEVWRIYDGASEKAVRREKERRVGGSDEEVMEG